MTEIYVGQYRDESGTYIPFSIKSDSIYEAEAWIRDHLVRRGYVLAPKVPAELLKEECWRRQGAHHSEVNMTYRRAKACLK